MKNIVHKKTYVAGIINLVAAALCLILIVALIVWTHAYSNVDITNANISEESLPSAVGAFGVLFILLSVFIAVIVLLIIGLSLVMIPVLIGGALALKESKGKRIISDAAYIALLIFKILALGVLAIIIRIAIVFFTIIPFVVIGGLVIAALYITAMVLEQSERTQARTVIKTLQ